MLIKENFESNEMTNITNDVDVKVFETINKETKKKNVIIRVYKRGKSNGYFMNFGDDLSVDILRMIKDYK